MRSIRDQIADILNEELSAEEQTFYGMPMSPRVTGQEMAVERLAELMEKEGVRDDAVTGGVAMTKDEFKRRWDLNDEGDNITYDDIAQCAKEWGLCSHPRRREMESIKRLVLKAANCYP